MIIYRKTTDLFIDLFVVDMYIGIHLVHFVRCLILFKYLIEFNELLRMISAI